MLARLSFLLAALVLMLSQAAFGQIHEEDWKVTLLLPEARQVDAAALANALQQRLAEHDKYQGIEPQEHMVVMRVGKGSALVSVTPTPLQDATEVCRRATWYWRSACEVVGAQKATAYVILRGSQLRKVESAVLMTKIVASVLEVSNASAVYWGNSLQSREAFLKGSDGVSVRNIPAMLWVDYQLRREGSGRVSIHTRGLKAFELMELEAKDVAVAGHDLLELMINTTQYLITRGPVLQDGDSIGGSPTRRVYIKQAESFANPGTKAYRIHFGG